MDGAWIAVCNIGVYGSCPTSAVFRAQFNIGKSKRDLAMKTLRKGDRGPEVRRLQERLIAAGCRLNPDALFGDGTDTALRAFQSKKGLTPDGVPGR